jgi:hypothetical protein
MKRGVNKPPPALNQARVLEYAVLDESVAYSGHSYIFIDGKELGPVPRLAICDGDDQSVVRVLLCDHDWTVLGVTGYGSLIETKNRLERMYHVASSCWVDAHVTKKQADAYLDKLSKGQRCSFCDKRPDQVEQMKLKGIEKSSARICDVCITELYQMLHEKQNSR